MSAEAPNGRVILNEPPAVYYARRLDEANATGMKHMLRSPAHFRHYVETPDDDKDSPAMAFGRAFHAAVLEPDTFSRQYVVVPPHAPGYPTKRQWDAKKPSPESIEAMQWWRDFELRHAGKTRLSGADYDRAMRMADNVRAHPIAAGLLVGGQREVTFRWGDEESGIACKARADLYLAGEYLMDVKTCRDASPDGFGRSVASYFYDLQQAHYLDGIRACGDSIRYFVFVACESEPPYIAQPYVLNAMGEERGWKLRAKALAMQAECLRTGRWPGYSDQLIELSMPTWAYYGLDEAA